MDILDNSDVDYTIKLNALNTRGVNHKIQDDTILYIDSMNDDLMFANSTKSVTIRFIF